jgi:hypothetical protein
MVSSPYGMQQQHALPQMQPQQVLFPSPSSNLVPQQHHTPPQQMMNPQVGYGGMWNQPQQLPQQQQQQQPLLSQPLPTWDALPSTTSSIYNPNPTAMDPLGSLGSSSMLGLFHPSTSGLNDSAPTWDPISASRGRMQQQQQQQQSMVGGHQSQLPLPITSSLGLGPSSQLQQAPPAVQRDPLSSILSLGYDDSLRGGSVTDSLGLDLRYFPPSSIK